MTSIYSDFVDSAQLLRKIQAKGGARNSKMILRHSLRDKIPKGSMGENVLLTREGERLVEHFGRHFSFEILRIHTSVIGRCVQTAEIFAKNYMLARGLKGEDSIAVMSEKAFLEAKDFIESRNASATKTQDSKDFIESKSVDSKLDCKNAKNIESKSVDTKDSKNMESKDVDSKIDSKKVQDLNKDSKDFIESKNVKSKKDSNLSLVKHAIKNQDSKETSTHTKKDSKLQIIKTHILSDSYIDDMKAAKWLFAKHSPYYIMQEFLRGSKLSGMKDKEAAMRILFSYIFSDVAESKSQDFKDFIESKSQNMESSFKDSIPTPTHRPTTQQNADSLEVFVTHDTFLIAIICYIFGIVPLNPAVESGDFGANLSVQNIDNTGFTYMKNGKLEQFTWPFMLEGAFLYYENDRIYCIFRGEVGSVEFRF